MFREYFKNRNLILLAGVILCLQLSGNAYAELCAGKRVKHTAKINFFKNKAGDLMAEIIPISAKGYYSRSGWTHCEMMASDIKEIYSDKIRYKKRIQGYFIVTYKIIEKDKYSIIPMYKGELLEVEPWEPSFLKSL
jgi:hypothetical protein